MYGYIYVIVNNINDKLYVGKHKYSGEGLDENYFCSGVLINKAIQKYGINNFTNVIIDTSDSLEELNNLEKFWIKELDCKAPKGYNLTDGGDGLCNPTEEVRYKCGSYWRGKKVPRNIVEIRSQSLRKPHTKEWNEHISLSLKGKPPTESVRLAFIEAKTGSHWYNNGVEEKQFKPEDVPEGWVKGTLKQRFNPESRRGTHLSDDTKVKMSNTLSKKVWCSNGVDSLFVEIDDVPPGYIIHKRITKEYNHSTNTGKHCYTIDGKQRKYIKDGDEIPEGYVLLKEFTKNKYNK